MSMTIFGWLLIASSIAISALFIVPLGSSGSRNERFDLDAWVRSSSWRLDQALRGAAGTLVVTAAVFLLVAGVGATTSLVGQTPAATGEMDADDEMLARLDDYARSIGSKSHASGAPDGKLLPDVNSMIERLAARLETAPGDAQGWRMLGWSYYNTGHYEQAVNAYAKAVQLDPSSAELQRTYEDAKSKASKGADLGSVASSQTGAVREGAGPIVPAASQPEAARPHADDAAIRAMVDGLADRLEKSPRDVEGWTRLMRSRVVLGEREVAATALRKALEVFKGESAESARIGAAAIELGLQAE